MIVCLKYLWNKIYVDDLEVIRVVVRVVIYLIELSDN